MKKLIIRLLIAFVVLVILGVLAMSLFLDKGIKRGIETVGPMLTKVDVKLASVSLSILSGSGKLKGLVVGNPEGFQTPSAIQVGNASLDLQPGSIFSDKVIIKTINVEAPEITFETDLKGNNLSKIVANLQAATGSGATTPATPGAPSPQKAAKKLQVDDFLITGGKVHVSVTALGGQTATVPLPEIHLTDMGKGPDGITAAELAQRVLQAIEKEAIKVSSGAVANLTKDAAGLTKGIGNTATGTVDTVTKGLGGLLKKK
jgi:uncharacterized protein involved in outer membrane biogenesis